MRKIIAKKILLDSHLGEGYELTANLDNNESIINSKILRHGEDGRPIEVLLILMVDDQELSSEQTEKFKAFLNANGKWKFEGGKVEF